MKVNPMKTAKLERPKNFLMAAALLPVMLATATATGTAQVVPVGARAYGKTYGEWTVAYWQWVLGIPFANNPWANDNTGEFAGVGQSGPVWFLGGTPGNSVIRMFTMPPGKGIFMPINQWIFGAAVFDCQPSVPSVPCHVPTLRAAAAAAANGVFNMAVSIDGTLVSNPFNYRAVSPTSFSVTLPADNVVGLAPGTYAPQVSDGYYLMLPPLAAGLHMIQVHVESTAAGGIAYDIAYAIIVAGP